MLRHRRDNGHSEGMYVGQRRVLRVTQFLTGLAQTGVQLAASRRVSRGRLGWPVGTTQASISLTRRNLPTHISLGRTTQGERGGYATARTRDEGRGTDDLRRTLREGGKGE